MIDFKSFKALKQICENDYGMNAEEFRFTGRVAEYFPMEELEERGGTAYAERSFNRIVGKMFSGYVDSFFTMDDYLNPMVLDPDGFKKICLAGDSFSASDWIRCCDNNIINRLKGGSGRLIDDVYYRNNRLGRLMW